jgi:folate-binding protein YgfZ
LEAGVALWQESHITIIRASHTAENGFDLFVEAKAAAALWEVLTNAGARPLGFDAFEILRIEAGQPRYGVDMDETNVVTETNLDDAISYTKGCYIGQEIVARIKYRGHVAKKLTGLMFERAVNVRQGATVRSLEDKEIGRITSATLSPHLGRSVALGYVKYDYLAPGTSVKVVSGDKEFAAQVTELPFVRAI